MSWLALATGGIGFVLSHRFRERIDLSAGAWLRALLLRVRRILETPPSPDEDLLLTGRLISSLQAGISLDAALEDAAREAPPGSPARLRIRAVLDGSPRPDFLSGFLRSALETGLPALAPLQNLERALRARRRLALKAVAAAGNCRAQAEVLSWLPWALAAAIAVIDTEWFLGAAAQWLSWLLWAFAILLAGFGRGWISRAVPRALRPRGEEERIEEEVLPELVLRVIADVSQGRDVETAVERSLAAAAPGLAAVFLAGEGGGPKLARLRSTLHHAARTGAPVREELTAFLQDLQAELECRWEERVQRLPVALLGPLFACFFPSSLLVLAGLLVPVFRAGL